MTEVVIFAALVIGIYFLAESDALLGGTFLLGGATDAIEAGDGSRQSTGCAQTDVPRAVRSLLHHRDDPTLNPWAEPLVLDVVWIGIPVNRLLGERPSPPQRCRGLETAKRLSKSLTVTLLDTFWIDPPPTTIVVLLPNTAFELSDTATSCDTCLMLSALGSWGIRSETCKAISKRRERTSMTI